MSDLAKELKRLMEDYGPEEVLKTAPGVAQEMEKAAKDQETATTQGREVDDTEQITDMATAVEMDSLAQSVSHYADKNVQKMVDALDRDHKLPGDPHQRLRRKAKKAGIVGGDKKFAASAPRPTLQDLVDIEAEKPLDREPDKYRRAVLKGRVEGKRLKLSSALVAGLGGPEATEIKLDWLRTELGPFCRRLRTMIITQADAIPISVAAGLYKEMEGFVSPTWNDQPSVDGLKKFLGFSSS